ncbi:MAG: YjbQ family protein [Candidatus Electrothrix sp. AW2]|nr:YjbQ family protein [Candidatus Electrothrix sp. AX1]MCI5135622.1 YjbQ family protein [Candidatus Electrothrix gigas]MCI5179786.1 YjbQ family protein [Candidatus Electrothrix gigas]MCI5181115.1 YjbQ family protein [Candidatus Electrothrix gigas]
MHFGKFSVSTQAQMQFIDITAQAEQAVREIGVADGILYLFNPHTTAGLTVNEGYDPDVQHDLLGVFKRVIPNSYPYRHAEGNSPSHILATLTGSSLTVILADNKLQLGTWQRIFFCEYDGPRNRHIMWKVMVG